MGRTFCTESGRMLLHANEKIARWRWARKLLRLPAGVGSAPADVWLCVCGYPGNEQPLVVRVNGRRAARVTPDRDAAGAWAWRSVRLPRGAVRGGVNEIILSSDNPAMNGWMLGIENSDWGHGRAQPIAMCVHYGMVFCSLAAALGHASRGLAVTEDVNGPNGHFMTEILDRDRSKWIAHDPNFDLHYEDEAGPMSGVELADRARAGRFAPRDMRRGKGFTSDCPRLNGLLDNKLATGDAFAAVAAWRRNDVVSDPAAAPPNHGSVVYCETDFVWYAPPDDERESLTAMFPYRSGDAGYFTAPPPRRGGRA